MAAQNVQERCIRRRYRDAIETLSSLGKTFLGDANLVPPCTIKFVCSQITVVARFSFRPSFHQRSLTGRREQIKGWNRQFWNLPTSVKSRNISEFNWKYDQRLLSWLQTVMFIHLHKIFPHTNVVETTSMLANRLRPCRRNDFNVGESTCRRNDWHPAIH